MSPAARALPHDIEENILLRLPAKSLVRFQIASRSWHSLISDPIFFKAHFNWASQNPNPSAHKALLSTSTRLILLDPLKSFSEVVDLQFPLERDNPRRLRIVGSCNGLVCLGLDEYRDIFIWNPSTGYCNKLPEPPTSLGDIYMPGFGYDSSSQDYKLVLVTSYLGPTKDSWGIYIKVATFSLKSNSWKICNKFNEALGNFITRCVQRDFPQSTFLNGAIHWRSGSTPRHCCILAFDLLKESFYSVPSPSLRLFFARKNGLGVLGGCLCMITSEGENSRFELWVMKEYGVKASWTKLMTLLNPEDGRYSYRLDFYDPLCASRDNTVTLIRNAKELIRFNERGEIVEKTCISNDKFGGVAFVESIESAQIMGAQRGEILDDTSTIDDDDSASA